jgi:hypothetical protein
MYSSRATCESLLPWEEGSTGADWSGRARTGEEFGFISKELAGRSGGLSGGVVGAAVPSC